MATKPTNYYDSPDDNPRIPAPKIPRVRYFNNQFLNDQDFIDEQMYHMAAQRRHGSLLHVAGVLEGLQVTKTDPPDAPEAKATVSAGTAYDGHGREILIDQQVDIKIDMTNYPLTGPTGYVKGTSTVSLYLVFNEEQTTGQGSDLTPKGVSDATLWEQRPQIVGIDPNKPTTVPDGGILLADIPPNLTPQQAPTDRRQFSGIALPSQTNPVTLRWVPDPNNPLNNTAQLGGTLSVTGQVTAKNGLSLSGPVSPDGRTGTTPRLVFDSVLGDKLRVWDTYGVGLNDWNLNLFIPPAAHFSLRQNSFAGPEVFSVTGAGELASNGASFADRVHMNGNSIDLKNDGADPLGNYVTWSSKGNVAEIAGSQGVRIGQSEPPQAPEDNPFPLVVSAGGVDIDGSLTTTATVYAGGFRTGAALALATGPRPAPGQTEPPPPQIRFENPGHFGGSSIALYSPNPDEHGKDLPGDAGSGPYFVIRRKKQDGTSDAQYLNSTWQWVQGSDRELKQDIVSLEHVLDRVMELRPVRFKWKSTQLCDMGFIAQEVAAIFPEIVDDGLPDPESGARYKGIAYSAFGVFAIAALQELNRLFDMKLEERMKELAAVQEGERNDR
jgi:hypothetical protein